MNQRRFTHAIAASTCAVASLILVLLLPICAIAQEGARVVVDDAAYLFVRERGIHRVSFEQLLDAGIVLDRDIGSIALSYRNKAVPVFVSDDSGDALTDGEFGPGHWIEFLAEDDETRYRRHAIYLLQSDRSLAARADIDDRNAGDSFTRFSRREVSWAPDRLYSRLSPTDDPWFARRLTAYREPVTQRVGFDLPDYVATSRHATKLRVALWGANESRSSRFEHRVTIRVNGTGVATRVFGGVTQRTIDIDLPPGTTRPGRNAVDVMVSNAGGASFSSIALESVSLNYPARIRIERGRTRVLGGAKGFEITEVTAPNAVVWRVQGDQRVRLVPRMTSHMSASGSRRRFWTARFPGARGATVRHEFATPEALKTPLIRKAVDPRELDYGNADYLLITHSSLVGVELDSLIAMRREQGLVVKVVDVDAIYRRYAGGNVDAHAIRDFIAFAYENLNTTQVLLVGGDSMDYKSQLRQRLRGTARSLIPTLYGAGPNGLRHEPVDPLFGDVDADGVPEVAVGRFPVQTVDELRALVTKSQQYEAAEYANSALFLADKDSAPTGQSFSTNARQIADALPTTWQTNTLALDEMNVDAVRSGFVEAIRNGVALTTWFGFSNKYSWSENRVVEAGDLVRLGNTGRPTVVTQIGCCNAWLVDPQRQSLAHLWLLDEDRGAAAVFGSASRLDPEVETALAQALVTALSVDRLSLGEALIVAKREIAVAFAPDRVRDALSGYLLLGDPALRLP